MQIKTFNMWLKTTPALSRLRVLANRYVAKMTKRLLILLCLYAATGSAQGPLRAEIVEDEKAAGCHEKYGDKYPFVEDSQRMVLKDGEVVAEFPFCSSYGKADVSLEQDVIGTHYLLLSYGEGRGSNVREDYLKIFKFSQKLIELKNFKLSAPSGFVSRWTYDYKISKPTSGGLQFLLTLSKEGDETVDIPAEEQVIFNVQ
jgi:hypothetical protein